jgi:hypothetical protein
MSDHVVLYAAASMPSSSSASVDTFLDDLVHPRKAEIEELRAVLLGSSPGMTERVKWNAPSFCVNGDDRITFRLQPGDRMERPVFAIRLVPDRDGTGLTAGADLPGAALLTGGLMLGVCEGLT